ncbi:Endoglucanase-4 [Arthrobotrys entomopaga]|nr:Endoglucanase-4 [Arthrobotrys entomopaga]
MRFQIALLSTIHTGLVVALWEQCGGIGWNGATICPTGQTCSSINPYYAQCLSPIGPTPTSKLTTTTTTGCTTANTCTVYPGNSPASSMQHQHSHNFHNI